MNLKTVSEVASNIVRFIRDLCIALLALLGGATVVSSCGTTTKAYVRNNADATTTMTISVTSPQNYTTEISPRIDSTTVKIH